MGLLKKSPGQNQADLKSHISIWTPSVVNPHKDTFSVFKKAFYTLVCELGVHSNQCDQIFSFEMQSSFKYQKHVPKESCPPWRITSWGK